MDEGWLEWSEVSPRLGDQLQLNRLQADEKVLHIWLPNCPLASIVINNATQYHIHQEEKDDDDDNNDIVHIHPLLFEFLTRLQTTWLTTMGCTTEKDVDQEHVFPVQLGPFPMEPQYFSNNGVAEGKSWRLIVMPVNEFPNQDGEILLSFIYIDPELLQCRRKVSHKMFYYIIQNMLIGRLVKQDSIMLLSCKYGFAIVEVTRIKFHSGQETTDTGNSVYRLPLESDKKWVLHYEFPEGISERPGTAIEHDSIWESTIPGYKYLVDQFLQIIAIHPQPAAPTGILLTGVPGVGKSRLASCIAYSHYMQQDDSSVGANEFHTMSEKGRVGSIFYLSIQDLIFQAVTESDLFESILVPGLRSATLWVLDDLHLLERDDGGDDEVQTDLEYVSVCNSIFQAIDEYHSDCFIVGICQDASKLPTGLTKNGRLEKQIEMFPPTQLERIAIWNHLLVRDIPLEPERNTWSTVLANNTAGCVAADLVRIHNDAWTRSLARNPQHEQPSTIEWADIREATRHCVPSQLSELDVIKSTVFDAGLDWREIHQESWKSFAGYEKLKKDIFRQVVVPWKMFLQHCDGNTGSKESGIDPPAGVLFHGEPGCGKTEAVRCLANSLELSMIQIRASDILDKWLGGSEALLRSLFSRARAAAPCILFIDEIDSIACNRAEDDTNDSSSRILSTLLNEMDGVSSDVRKSKIVIVACTNRLEALDAALLRPGRLQEHFEITRPTLQDLIDILNLYLNKIPLAQDVFVEKVAENLLASKASGAEVVGLCREVCLSALRKDYTPESLVVSHDDFVEASLSSP